MLKLTLLPEEYLLINDSIVVQLKRVAGGRVDVAIEAPREFPIVRGAVLERNGGQRPGCVMDVAPHYVRQLPWDHRKKQALAELREVLEGMDGDEARTLREKLDVIFPVSPGPRPVEI